jgi:iron complex outermembrane receptor protein
MSSQRIYKPRVTNTTAFDAGARTQAAQVLQFATAGRLKEPLKQHSLQHLRPCLSVLAIAAAGLTLHAVPQSADAQSQPAQPAQSAPEPQLKTERIVVTATRVGREERDIPRSVTVISGAELQRELAATADIGAVLGKLVPGMSTSVEGRNNARGQDQIRGRRFLLLIDGIPQDRTFLDTRQDFKSISAEAIERIEVIRGGTAVYGLNATGGIINLITKSGKGAKFGGVALAKLLPVSEDGSKLGWNAYAHVHGAVERFDYFVGIDASRTGGRYDARGALIPSATVGSGDFNKTLNLNLKLGATLSEDLRLQYSLNRFDSEDYERYYPCRGVLPVQGSLSLSSRTGGGTVAGAVTLCGARPWTAATAPAEGQAAEAVPIPVGADEPANAAQAIANDSPPYGFLITNHVLSLTAASTPLGTVQAALYHQTRSAVTASFIFRRSAQNPPPPGQSAVLGFGYNDLRHTRTGLRTTVDSELSPAVNLVWGIDVEQQDFSQPNTLGQLPTSPDYEQATLAPFAQAEWKLGPWRLSGGARWERLEVDIPTFTTALTAPVRSHTVEGGTLVYREPLYNLGAVFDVMPGLQAFGSVSQGLTLGEVLRAIRATTRTDVKSTLADVQPVKVDAIELGLRGQHAIAQGSLAWTAAVFRNKSPLGATLTRDPTTFNVSTVRAPEEVHGAELSVDWRNRAGWAAGGAFSTQRGTRTLNGVTEALPGTRIAPDKLNAYAQAPVLGGRVRLEVLRTGARDEFPNGTVNAVFSANVVGGDAEGAGRVTPLTLFNASAVWPIGPGELTVSVVNLANKYYIPPTLQALNDPRAYYPGQGRAFGIMYRTSW